MRSYLACRKAPRLIQVQKAAFDVHVMSRESSLNAVMVNRNMRNLNSTSLHPSQASFRIG